MNRTSLNRGERICGQETAADTPVLEIRKPKKRTNSDREQEKVEAACTPWCVGPQVSSSRSEHKLEMTLTVRLELCEQLEGRDGVTGTPERQADATSPCPMPELQVSLSEASGQQPEALGTSAEGAIRAKAVPASKTMRQHSVPQDNGGLTTEFGSALEPRGCAVWGELCGATDYEAGQLRGDVGTPEDPLFTYEEAVCQRHAEQDLMLCVGRDIIPVDGGALQEIAKQNLKKLRRQADEARLPELPKGLLPGGWDTFGRPWALMDCLTEKVPQIPSMHGEFQSHGCSAGELPSRTFLLVDLMHMDGVIRVWNKVCHRPKGALPGELKDDGTLKLASMTYGRLKLPVYGHSVPVQEPMTEPHWSAYRKGRWGRRQNPSAPIRDVRPGAAVNVPVGERSIAPVVPIPSDNESSSGSSSPSQHDSDSPDSSLGPRQRVRHLTHRIPPSDPEEASEETGKGVTSTTAPEFPALRIAPTTSMIQAVTNSVFYTSQV